MGTLRAYLQLVRLPAVFTAMADIFLGYLLTHSNLATPADFVRLLLASSCLYASGMVFNDVFDRKIDSEERPHRPIPSGSVPLPSAVILGVLLMGAGIAAAASVSRQSLIIAVLLAACILGYDALLKRTVLSPVIMGTCRFLNIMLGASQGFFVWARPQLLVAPALGMYIAGVTWFARTEAQVSSRSMLAAAVAVLNVGLAGLIGFVLYWNGEAPKAAAILLLLVVAVSIHRRAIPAVFQPLPERVQPAVGTMLLSLVMLDAAIVYFKTGSPAYGLATAGLLVPSLLTRRWITMT
jgi:4-hydroxybenzoate polyprenyltransferase